MTQVVARVPEELVAAVDALVDDGTFRSRSEAVRVGLDRMIDDERRSRNATRDIEGYTRFPETEEEIAWADADLKQFFTEDPEDWSEWLDARRRLR